MKVRNPEQISIPASNTTKDPGLTHSQIIRMVNLVKKTEKVRIFEPDKNLRADAWKFDYRLYYDLFVKKSLQDTIYAYTR